MRILHTSDWHIGRSFHGHATLDALRGVLDTLAAQVRHAGAACVLVTHSAAAAARADRVLTLTASGMHAG